MVNNGNYVAKRFVAWLVLVLSCAGFGLWLCCELGALMPWSRSAVGGSGWEWVWFVPAKHVAVSVLRGLGLYGFGFVGVVWCLVWCVRLAVRRFCGDFELVAFSPLLVFMPGLLLFVAACVLFCVSLFSLDERMGVLLWCAFLLAGRMAVLAVLWQGFVCDELVGLLSPVVRRFGLWIVCAFAVGLAVLVYTQHYMSLHGDEKSYVYTMVSLVEGEGQLPSAERVKDLDKVFGRIGGFHTVVNPATSADVPWHFVGASLFLVPLYELYRFGFGAHGAQFVRGYMLIWFMLWVVGSYVLSHRLTGRAGASLAATVLCAFSFPALGLAASVYPDCIAGYVLLFAFLCGGDVWVQAGGRLRLGQCVLILVCACYLPFLHVKYGLCSVVLGCVVLWFRPLPLRLKAVAVCGSVFAFLSALFALYYYKTYGFFLPGAPPAWSERTGRFGIFFDTDSGALLYAPWWLLLPFGVWFLRRLSGRWAYSVVWSVLFVVVYQIASSVPFWGSSGSPVLRYLAPALGVCIPVLAGVFVAFERRWLPVVLLASVSFVLLLTYQNNPFDAYGSATQKGRMLWDNTFSMFSVQDFFAYFNFSWRKLHTPFPVAHRLMMCGAFGLFLVGAGLWRVRRFSVVAMVLLLQLPFSLAGAAVAAHSGVWGMSAVRLFAEQSARVGSMEVWRKSQLRNLLGASSDADLTGVVRTVVRLPIVLRPMEDVGGRQLSADNALVMDKKRKDGEFSRTTLLPELPGGKYRVALHGRAAGDSQGTGTITMRVALDKQRELVNVTSAAVPQRAPENSVEVGAVVLVDGAFELALENGKRESVNLYFSSQGAPEVWVDYLLIEYLGVK